MAKKTIDERRAQRIKWIKQWREQLEKAKRRGDAGAIKYAEDYIAYCVKELQELDA